jgi:hypothetical protein
LVADYFEKERFDNEDGALYQLGEQRMATFFFYLNTVEEGGGGETVRRRATGAFCNRARVERALE